MKGNLITVVIIIAYTCTMTYGHYKGHIFVFVVGKVQPIKGTCTVANRASWLIGSKNYRYPIITYLYYYIRIDSNFWALITGNRRVLSFALYMLNIIGN